MSSLELVEFNPGDVLFRENEETYFFYMIKEGKVEVYRETSTDQRVVLAVVEDGQSLGEFAMIDKQARSASARALTRVVAVKVSEESYASLLTELPTWAQAMLEGLVSRLRTANEIIRQNESIDEETRTGFNTSEFDADLTKTVEIDFAELTVADFTKKAS